MASDTGSSTGSGGSGGNVKADHKGTSAKDVLKKRRRPSGRQDDVLERHCHHSVSGNAGGRGQVLWSGPQAPKVDEGRGRTSMTPGTTYRHG